MPSKRSAQSSAKTLRTYLYPLLGFVLLLTIILFIYHERHSSTVVDATTHKTQPYTELYFSDPTHLPSVTTSGQQLPLNFTIHNVEGQSLTYVYAVTFTNPAGVTTTLSQQRMYVAAGQTATVDPGGITLPSYQGRGEVSIVLLKHPEAIHVWIDSQS